MTRAPRVARVAAQAKINLMLRVGARETSGYHDILTVFHRIDLADDVVVHTDAAGESLEVSGPRLPAGGLGPPAQNLAFRAAQSYARVAGWPSGFHVALTKRIPVGGGLGGGSADAAAVLRAMDALAPRPLGAPAIQEIGAQLGADVAFLASPHAAALGSGRGERLQPLDALEQRAVALVVPSFGVSTAEAYAWIDADRGPGYQASGLEFTPARPGELREWIRYGNEGDHRAAGNDFEASVERRHPVLRAYREGLRDRGAIVARLSGSGSTVFGVFAGAIPVLEDLTADALVLTTRTSTNVVPVEVLE